MNSTSLTEIQRTRLPNIVSGGAVDCLRDFIRLNYSTRIKSEEFKTKPAGRKANPNSKLQIVKSLIEEGFTTEQIVVKTGIAKNVIHTYKSRLSKKEQV